MIKHLQTMKDPIVSKLKQSELNLITMENAYHSPEESEKDPDSSLNNHIVIRNLKWRSSSVSLIVVFFFLQIACSNSFYFLNLHIFLRDYVDTLYYQQKSNKRKRNQVHNNTEFVFNETAAPLNAP